MIRNKKGQALIEFVLILPVLLLLIFGMIDLGKIVLRKSELDNLISDKITVWKNSGENIDALVTYLKDENIEVKITKNKTTSFITVDVYEKVDWFTPVVSNILDDYTIHIKRVVADE